jgi:ATP-dependent helicase HrpA
MDAYKTELLGRIDLCQGKDRHRFRRRLKRANNEGEHAKLERDVDASVQNRERRIGAVPDIQYPHELPVSQRRAEIAQAIANHPVVILCGETGSGKTTQLPKICLEIGRGIDGLIGHTQPRRLAARTVANRIAEEMHSELGQIVGFQTRFQQRLSDGNLVKVMTDGILLAETQRDKWLNRYDTIILDEAHERSLNVDFLLGYLKQLVRRRGDLKLIVTSATLDVERISAHFPGAPVIEVKGRTYPVDIRYRPLSNPDDDLGDLDVTGGINQAIEELQDEAPGDTLVFLPGEREIREASRSLRHLRDRFEIHALYARLPPAEQQRIFKRAAKPRIILSTNVAETSLTVPGIRYVIDSGTARISRYSWRSQIQRLPIEDTSQASANQRAGRCGRTAPGICVRLYSEDDFNARSEFTQPEIQRTNLAAVILQMASLGLGDVAQFDFIDPPDSRLVKDGYRLLHELQAVGADKHLTTVGKRVARLPIDPRLGRILLAAADYGSLTEVLVIATAIAVQDPRDRPFDKRQAADEQHQRFTDKRSDFVALLNLWNYLESQSESLSQAAMRRQCVKQFINFKRWREWRDLHRQLALSLRALDLRFNTSPADYESIHRALLSGYLDHIGMKTEKNSFLGSRNRTFFPFPGSALRAKPPKWIMAAEITETTRVYARTLAGIDPRWVEEQASHLLKRHVSEPHWQKKVARTAGYEKLTLNGLVINPKRTIDYAPIDPRIAREFFIRHALVYGQWKTNLRIVRDNQAMIASIEDLERQTRRQDILIHEDEIFQFYDDRLPSEINSGAGFTKWCKGLNDDAFLKLSRDHLVREQAPQIAATQYPKTWRQDGFELPLSYQFSPGAQDDGVTLTIPLVLLGRIDADQGDWLVPGLIEQKVTALIRALPKRLRKNFVPVPQFAQAATEAMVPNDGELLESLSRVLHSMTGVEIDRSMWSLDIEAHLLMRFAVSGGAGEILGSGRNLPELRDLLTERMEARPVAAKQLSFEKDAVVEWDFGELPAHLQCEEDGYTIERYPALAEEGRRVALRLFDDPDEANASMRVGLRRLVQLQLKKESRYLEKNIPDVQRLRLLFSPIGSAELLTDDMILAAIERCFIANREFPRDSVEFEHFVSSKRSQLVDNANDLARVIGKILDTHFELRNKLDGDLPLSWVEAAQDINAQLQALVFPGFICATPMKWLERMPRFLKAINVRIAKLNATPDRDRMRRSEIEPLFARLQLAIPDGAQHARALDEYKWKLEELRVSLFAQELGSLEKVSVKRLDKLWQETC